MRNLLLECLQRDLVTRKISRAQLDARQYGNGAGLVSLRRPLIDHDEATHYNTNNSPRRLRNRHRETLVFHNHLSRRLAELRP